MPQTYLIARRRHFGYVIGLCIQNMTGDNSRKKVLALDLHFSFIENVVK
jgi:hypothetical protein